MKAALPWIYFSVIRVAVFAAPLAILLVLHIDFWISVIAAAIIGWCVSYLFLRKPREKMSAKLYEIQQRDRPKPTIDDDIEDDIVEHSLDGEASGEEPSGSGGRDATAAGGDRSEGERPAHQ